MKLENKEKSIKDIYKSFFIYPFQLLCSSILITIIARGLGPFEFGKYSLCITFVTLISIPICSGFPNLLIRECAYLKSENNYQKINNLLLYAIRIIFLFTFLYAFIILVLNFIIKDGKFNYLSNIFLISIFLVPSLGLNRSLSAVNKGIGNSIIGLLSENFHIQFIFLMLYIFCNSNKQYFLNSAENILILNIIASILGLIILYAISSKNIILKFKNFSFHSFKKSPFSKSSFFNFSVIQLMYNLNAQLDIIFLGIFSSLDIVGNYKLLVQLTLICGVYFNIITQIVAPKIASLYFTNKKKELEIFLLRVNKLSIFIGISLTILVIIFGDKLFSKFFGQHYILDIKVLLILLIGQLIVVISGAPNVILNMTDNENLTLNGLYVAVIINIGLNFLLVPIYGTVGASIATVLSLLIRNIFHIRMIKYTLGINNNLLLSAFEKSKI